MKILRMKIDNLLNRELVLDDINDDLLIRYDGSRIHIDSSILEAMTGELKDPRKGILIDFYKPFVGADNVYFKFPYHTGSMLNVYKLDTGTEKGKIAVIIEDYILEYSFTYNGQVLDSDWANNNLIFKYILLDDVLNKPDVIRQFKKTPEQFIVDKYRDISPIEEETFKLDKSVMDLDSKLVKSNIGRGIESYEFKTDKLPSILNLELLYFLLNHMDNVKRKGTYKFRGTAYEILREVYGYSGELSFVNSIKREINKPSFHHIKYAGFDIDRINVDRTILSQVEILENLRKTHPNFKLEIEGIIEE